MKSILNALFFMLIFCSSLYAEIRLNVAIKAGNLEHVREFLKAGDSIYELGDEEKSPLDLALGLDNKSEVKHLVINHPDKHGVPPVLKAIYEKKEDLAEKLINAKAALIFPRHSDAISHAENASNRIKRLVANATDVDGFPWLVTAIKKNRFDKVEALVKMGASPWERGVLEATLETETIPKIRDFILNIKNRDGETFLINAVKADNLVLVKALAAAGADIWAQDRTGKTALYYADQVSTREKPRPERVREYKEVISKAQDAFGSSVLNNTLLDGLYLRATTLVGNRANPREAGSNGVSAIDLAISGQVTNYYARTFILNYKNWQNKTNDTPLIEAVKAGDDQRVLRLLKAQANPFASNYAKENAFTLAEKLNRKQMLTFLEPYRDFMGFQGTTIDILYRTNIVPLIKDNLTGNGINVAVFDDGVNFRDPDLSSIRKIEGGGVFSGLGDTPPQIWALDEVYTTHGHGTSVAKMLAGKVNNDNLRGVAPNVAILPMSNGLWGTLLAASKYLKESKNIHISVVSLQFGSFYDIWNPDTPKNTNALTVVIAGNGFNRLSDLEKNLPLEVDLQEVKKNLIITIGVDQDNQLANDSRVCDRLKDICIAVPTHGPTSPTAPVVGGVLALLMEKVPGKTMHQYQQAILKSATPLPEGPAKQSSVGLLNAEAVLKKLQEM